MNYGNAKNVTMPDIATGRVAATKTVLKFNQTVPSSNITFHYSSAFARTPRQRLSAIHIGYWIFFKRNSQ